MKFKLTSDSSLWTVLRIEPKQFSGVDSNGNTIQKAVCDDGAGGEVSYSLNKGTITT